MARATPNRLARAALLCAVAIVAAACGSSPSKTASTTTTRPPDSSAPSGPTTTAPGHSTTVPAGAVDSCVVGTWHALALTLIEPSTGARVVGGAGAVLTVAPDGALSLDLAGSDLFVGTTSGQSVSVTARGSERSQLAARSGSWSETDRDPSRLSLQTLVGGQQVPPVSPSKSAVTGRYTCSPTQLTVQRSTPPGTDAYRH